MPLPPEVAERTGQRRGLRVVEVVPGSPAGVAGIDVVAVPTELTR